MSARGLSRALVEQFCAFPGISAPVPFAFLRQHGQQMPISPMNAAYAPRGRVGQCYANSACAASRMGLWYCEGYAVPGKVPIPIPHAWLCDAQGAVIDPTWGDGSDYFGAAFTHEFVADFTCETGYHGLLCNLYLLRSKRSAADVLDYLNSGVAQLGAVC